ncbi:hypothetical protein I302_103449 [Kwoniella bestiolae CBS 10118]|uniref:Uncharacterized protein n=1 Tax=Kwoniella bestiolae CBS 10118 TaxID=1296100 RepID=A0A1B9G8F5_9TREE|nr:hypothetical protein I302_02149 [Kwoniella bestiolae CBS 10118]OCF27308.1 hypothetical protein I302_02149 [Kwoniella bestiolae CBS 10118]
MSQSTDATSAPIHTQTGESHNARLYLDEIDQGAIDTWTMPEDGVGVLRLLEITATLRVHRTPGDNYTQRLIDDGVNVQLPSTTFKGKVDFGGQEIPVEGTIHCDLINVHILGTTNEKRRGHKKRISHQAIATDVISAFETIAVSCHCKSIDWINCRRFNKSEWQDGPSPNSRVNRWYIDVCWDPQTRTVSRNYNPTEPVLTHLRFDTSNTKSRNLISLIDETGHWREVTDQASDNVREIKERNKQMLADTLPERTNASPRVSLTGSTVDPSTRSGPRKHSELVSCEPGEVVRSHSRQVGFGKLIPRETSKTYSEPGPSNVDR